METPVKKTRLEFLFDVFKKDYDKAIKANVLEVEPRTRKKPDTDVIEYCDRQFNLFYKDFFGLNSPEIKGETSIEKIFNYFVHCDPSPNKEYVSWFLNLYRDNIKTRAITNEIVDPSINVFFEDLQTKVTEALEVFSFLKLTNVLSVEARDINRYKSIHQFVNMVKPYMAKDDGDDSVHTLDHKELACIHNYTHQTGKPGNAELVFENNDWIVVITHDKEANVEFGKYTTWCTAGTRYGSMFDSYHGRGELFVLIKKGFGSKKAIKKDVNVRLQFHFEDNMYMHAEDRAININEFLFDNKDIKKYFRTYIIKHVLPARQKKNTRQTDDIKYLLNLGFGDEIIKILKESKPEVVDFSGHKIETEYLESIGEITSIKKLDLSECDLDRLPDSIANLKNLKSIKFRNNKKIKTVPSWINNLVNLEYFDCAGCDINEIGDLTENKNLTELVLDYNQNLKKLPVGIGNLTRLTRLTASTCDLREIDNELLNCTNLYLMDVHMNQKLETIPVGLSKLPSIVAICIDDTKISMQTKKLMEENSNGSVCIIKYGQ
jgi:hypothetical protein